MTGVTQYHETADLNFGATTRLGGCGLGDWMEFKEIPSPKMKFGCSQFRQSCYGSRLGNIEQAAQVYRIILLARLEGIYPELIYLV
jgi:hypothetical protein